MYLIKGGKGKISYTLHYTLGENIMFCSLPNDNSCDIDDLIYLPR